MSNWDSESFDEVINRGHFSITQPGPLHTPIHSFAVRRNEKLELVLETHCPEDAKSDAIQHPSGTVRINTDTIELTNIGGLKACAIGVQPLHVLTSLNHETGARGLCERSRIQEYIEATLRDDIYPNYTIDWLENLQAHDFIWPDSIKDNKQITETRAVGGQGGIILSSTEEERAFGQRCVAFTVAGFQLYLCVSRSSNSGERSTQGCIIYVGTPDEDVRRKIRTAISYSLGTYLVYLGNTAYSHDWQTIYIKAVSAYSIGRRVFDLPVLPPAPLGSRFQHEITSQALGRMVNGIYSQYDSLKFGSLSWAYWHALCATMHIAAAHFGAAIEALERNYVKAHHESFKTTLVSERAAWRTFLCEIRQAIIKLEIPDEDKQILLDRIGSLNETPRSITMKRLLETIDIELGEDEQRAWKRRNDAAHGNEIRQEEQLQVIRDTKLLRGIFDRMLLRIVNGSDIYYDYVTVGFPVRNLRDPVPSEPITSAPPT
jgi:hypothetical protein